VSALPALGLVGYLVSILASYFFAFGKKNNLCWKALGVSVAIPIGLSILGFIENDTHGTGLDGLGMVMLFWGLPAAFIVTSVSGVICLWLLNRSVSDSN
jgi:hypothetical protein